MDSHQDSRLPQKRGGTPPVEHQFKIGNPGGSAPKGKRISTYMAQYGDLPPSKWPTAKQLEKLPANASIALARLKKARRYDGIRDTELILDRTEGAVVPEPSLPMLSQIAAAILALKAAGVEVRKPIEAEVVASQQIENEEEDDETRAKRFRRGRP